MRFIALPDGSCRLFNKKGRLLPLSALPNPSRVMVIDTIPDGPYDHMDTGFNPLPVFRCVPGWAVEELPYRKEWRKGPGNGWKQHRDSQYRPVNKEVA